MKTFLFNLTFFRSFYFVVETILNNQLDYEGRYDKAHEVITKTKFSAFINLFNYHFTNVT